MGKAKVKKYHDSLRKFRDQQKDIRTREQIKQWLAEARPEEGTRATTES